MVRFRFADTLTTPRAANERRSQSMRTTIESLEEFQRSRCRPHFPSYSMIAPLLTAAAMSGVEQMSAPRRPAARQSSKQARWLTRVAQLLVATSLKVQRCRKRRSMVAIAAAISGRRPLLEGKARQPSVVCGTMATVKPLQLPKSPRSSSKIIHASSSAVADDLGGRIICHLRMRGAEGAAARLCRSPWQMVAGHW